ALPRTFAALRSPSNALDEQFFVVLHSDSWTQSGLRQYTRSVRQANRRVSTPATLVEHSCLKFVDIGASLCYGLISFHASQAPGNDDVPCRGGGPLTHASPGTRNEQFGPARPSVPDFHRLYITSRNHFLTEG